MRFTKGHYAFTVCTHTDKKIEFLKDIEAKLREGKGQGYINWAKRFNAKHMAKTILFLQDHKIESFEQLKNLTDERSGRLSELQESMKAKEALLVENKKRQQAIIDYAKNRKVYEFYKRSGYSQKFYQEHESELLIYQYAEEVYKSILGGKSLLCSN